MIEFEGIDIVAERHIEEPQLRHAISETLSVPEERISVIDDIADHPPKHCFDVVCVRTTVYGQFAEILSVQCEKRNIPRLSELEVLALLAGILKTRCLMPAEGPNPYVMWSSDSGKPPELVTLDPTSLDADHYNITK